MSVTTSLTFHLDELRVTCPKEKVRLLIAPSFKVDCPVDILDYLQPSDILESLKSGSIWSSRGFACQMNLRISLLGTSFINHGQAIEELGTSIRNAELWKQLSLAPSLEIPNSGIAPEESDIRIRISHMQPDMLEEVVSELSAIPADTKPPDGIPCLGLTGLELDLQFKSFSTARRTKPKRARISKDSMLLDNLDFNDECESLSLRDVESGPKSSFLSDPPDSEIVMMTFEHNEPLQCGEEDGSVEILLLDTNLIGLPKRVQTSKDSMLLDSPDFNDVCESVWPPDVQSGLKSSSFSTAPVSEIVTMKLEHNDPLQSGDKNADNDILLLAAHPTELPTPPSSAAQSLSSQAASPMNVKRPMNTEESDCRCVPSSLNVPVALALTDLGLRTLIGGRPMKTTPGVSVLKPEQKYALSDLIPSLWSPGYLKAVSQRSRFLPILSQSMSKSILRNAQSPSLKKSLLKLAEMPPSSLVSQTHEDYENSSAHPLSRSQKASRVVQARLWRMTQQSLLDPLAARKLRRMDVPVDGAPRLWEHASLLEEDIKGMKSSIFSSLVDDLAEFMDEERFEESLDEDEEEECAISQDFAANSDELDPCVQRWDAAAADKLCVAEHKVHDASTDIPDELCSNDLRLGDEGGAGALENERFVIPESFWEDLRMLGQDRGLTTLETQSNSDMLI